MVSILSDIASPVHCTRKGDYHHHHIKSHVPANYFSLPNRSEIIDAPAVR
jgi:hypothetical protein